MICARRAERLERLAAQIAASGAPKPIVVVGDLGRRGGAVAVAEEVRSHFDGIDVLVNNAGSAAGGAVHAVGDRDEARHMFEVDFWSPLALIASFVPDMRRRGHGAVVNVTSLRQVFTWPLFGHSSAAKAALAMATETLRLELSGSNIRVIDVAAGPVETPAMGPTALIPGIKEVIHARLGTARPDELAGQVVRAVELGEPRVFCPDESGRSVYENPAGFRDEIAREVTRLFDEGILPDDESLDSLVVGPDDPMLQDARAQWEREHGSLELNRP